MIDRELPDWPSVEESFQGTLLVEAGRGQGGVILWQRSRGRGQVGRRPIDRTGSAGSRLGVGSGREGRACIISPTAGPGRAAFVQPANLTRSQPNQLPARLFDLLQHFSTQLREE